MPELPEVEGFRQYLQATSLGRRIESVAVRRRRILRGTSSARLREALTGSRLVAADRHGKYVFATPDRGGCLVLHFGMSGRLKVFRRPVQRPPHTRLLVRFADGSHLAYVCPRMLGGVSITLSAEHFVREHGLGPDALSVSRAEFKAIFAARRGMVKPALMNQRNVAGLGNLYTDEILFQASVHPRTPLGRLSEAQLDALYRSTRRILRTSIRRRAEYDELPRSYLLPGRDEACPCPRCGGRIVRSIVGGRATYHCPRCQRRPRVNSPSHV